MSRASFGAMAVLPLFVACRDMARAKEANPAVEAVTLDSGAAVPPSAGMPQGAPPPRPDTLPEIVSVVTDTVAVPARSDLMALTFRIGRGPEPGRLRVSTTLRNLGPPVNAGGSAARLTWGGCSFVLRAYRNPDLEGEPVWHSFGPCLDIGFMPRLLPGDSVGWADRAGRHLGWNGHMLDILGDSLPEGRYFFQAQIEFVGMDTLRLPAGSVNLRRVPRSSRARESSGRP